VTSHSPKPHPANRPPHCLNCCYISPLIVDQPEDDLDNRVIMRIVEIIRTSKNHRQLIFATHNPNIVVKGDADKVIALRSGEPVVGAEPEAPRVQLSKDGAIETTDVRDAITRIMEGGKEAVGARNQYPTPSAPPPRRPPCPPGAG
jgi:ABC-type multidrug transport system ATPase subunit